MATNILSPSPPAEDATTNNNYDDASIPTAALALPSVAIAPSRRLPPPCWSPDETAALIDAYRDKWYSLRRGNLRANHWQEVADDVASRSPASPPKTAVQCRHKMEKLRKRYRAEIQRAAAHGGPRRYASSWAHFHRMHAMERGPNPSPPSSSSTSDDDDDDEEAQSDHKNGSSVKRINNSYNYNQGILAGPESTNGPASAFRIKIPGRFNPGPSLAPNPNNPRLFNFAPNKFPRDGFNGKCEIRKKGNEILTKTNKGDSGVGGLVAAIHSLGEGFIRMEKMKMNMVRQVEEMRMEMELKRTEMILESEQRILEAFAKAITERGAKRSKRNSPES